MTATSCDSVVVVTGAARGIGEAVAAVFAQQGAAVVVADIDAPAAELVAERLAGPGRVVTACATDVSSPESVDALFDHALAVRGRVDVVVNNAGLVHVSRFDELTLHEWRRVFAVNSDGAFLMTRRAGVVMREQAPHPVTACRGKIVNVSSMAAEYGRPFLAAYGASKAALNHISKTAALVFGEFDVATTVVYPGNIREGMWRDLGSRLAALEQRPTDEVEGERSFQTAHDFAGVVFEVVMATGMGLNGAVVDATTGSLVVRPTGP